MGDPEPKGPLEPVPGPGPDLILERRNEKGEKVLQFVLSNVHRQMYTFGSKYPGARDGEEFVFCRQLGGDERLIEGVEATHCTISVDEAGNYWIKKATRTAETFVNLEKIVEPRILSKGDFISLGIAKNCWCKPGPLFHIELRLPDSNILELENLNENPEGAQVEVFGDSPLDNVLIVSKILDYLSFGDLKNSRLVCKKWNEEGSKILQNKGLVCFAFNGDYGKPQNSTGVFRYLQEMKRLKIRTIKIRLSPTERPFFAPGEPGEKMLDDLRKLLNSPHNFSSLMLKYSRITNESSFSLLHLVLEKLGPKLVELELSGSIQFFPKIAPPLPEMNNLKKLKTHETSVVLVESKKWVSLLVPLFRKNLEQFSICDSGVNDASVLYLEEFLKHEMPKLEGFEINDDLDDHKLSLLLKFKNPFSYLYLCYSQGDEAVIDPLLDKLLWRNSQTLKHLVLNINNCVTIKFPAFPKLEKLHFMYSSEVRISWGSVVGLGLDYKVHLPSLRNLKIDLFDEPFKLTDNHVFNSFFSEKMNCPCKSVTQLSIPVVRDPDTSDIGLKVKQWREMEEDYKKFRERFKKIKKMFPKVEKFEAKELYSMDVD